MEIMIQYGSHSIFPMYKEKSMENYQGNLKIILEGWQYCGNLSLFKKMNRSNQAKSWENAF